MSGRRQWVYDGPEVVSYVTDNTPLLGMPSQELEQ